MPGARRSTGRWLLLVGLSGCGAATQAEPQTAAPPAASTSSAPVLDAPRAAKVPDTGELHVELRVEARLGDVVRPVGRCDALRSRDHLAFHVTVTRPAFVYVVQLFSDGKTAVLYPPTGDVELPAGVARRVPPEPDIFELDDAPGEENVFVVASRRPLAEADRAVSGQLEALRAPSSKRFRTAAPSCGPAPTAPSKRAPGPGPGPGAGPEVPSRGAGGDVSVTDWNSRSPFPLVPRGLRITADPASKAVRGEADAAGVYVYPFAFVHLPR